MMSMDYECDQCGLQFSHTQAEGRIDVLDGDPFTVHSYVVCPYCGCDGVTDLSDDLLPCNLRGIV